MKDVRSVLVAGCGRLGCHLAEFFSAQGSDVVVLDNDARAFERLAAEFSGFAIEGSAAECGALRKAGVESADLFVAVTDSDALNIMSAELALRYFGVPRVFARVYEPALEEFCRSLGVLAVSPITSTVGKFLEVMSHAAQEG